MAIQLNEEAKEKFNSKPKPIPDPKGPVIKRYIFEKSKDGYLAAFLAPCQSF